jgi:hypothetical protein
MIVFASEAMYQEAFAYCCQLGDTPGQEVALSIPSLFHITYKHLVSGLQPSLQLLFNGVLLDRDVKQATRPQNLGTITPNAVLEFFVLTQTVHEEHDIITREKFDTLNICLPDKRSSVVEDTPTPTVADLTQRVQQLETQLNKARSRLQLHEASRQKLLTAYRAAVTANGRWRQQHPFGEDDTARTLIQTRFQCVLKELVHVMTTTTDDEEADMPDLIAFDDTPSMATLNALIPPSAPWWEHAVPPPPPQFINQAYANIHQSVLYEQALHYTTYALAQAREKARTQATVQRAVKRKLLTQYRATVVELALTRQAYERHYVQAQLCSELRTLSALFGLDCPTPKNIQALLHSIGKTYRATIFFPYNAQTCTRDYMTHDVLPELLQKVQQHYELELDCQNHKAQQRHLALWQADVLPQLVDHIRQRTNQHNLFHYSVLPQLVDQVRQRVIRNAILQVQKRAVLKELACATYARRFFPDVLLQLKTVPQQEPSATPLFTAFPSHPFLFQWSAALPINDDSPPVTTSVTPLEPASIAAVDVAAETPAVPVAPSGFSFSQLLSSVFW